LKDEIKKLKDKKKQLSKKGPYLKTKNKRINKNFELNDKIKKTNQINKWIQNKKNKNQENGDQIFKKKTKIMDLKMKWNTN